MLLGKGPLGDLLYPLYFKANVGTFVVPSESMGWMYVMEAAVAVNPAQLGRSRAAAAVWHVAAARKLSAAVPHASTCCARLASCSCSFFVLQLPRSPAT